MREGDLEITMLQTLPEDNNALTFPYTQKMEKSQNDYILFIQLLSYIYAQQILKNMHLMLNF